MTDILLQVLPVTKAANNILDTGLLGAFLILSFSYLVWSERKWKKFTESMMTGLTREKENKDKENNELEKNFREYLMFANKEHHEIIRENTKVMRHVIIAFEKLMLKLEN